MLVYAPMLSAQTVKPTSEKPLAVPSNLLAERRFYSAHFDTDKGLRNSNPGFGVEAVINEDWSATAGGFINSAMTRIPTIWALITSPGTGEAGKRV